MTDSKLSKAYYQNRELPEKHQEADGQIIEWDEKFKVNGEEMDAPGVGGSASNVINCRCQLLQRARWMLTEKELERLQERAEFFGLDKTESFEAFKEKNLKQADNSSGLKMDLQFLHQNHRRERKRWKNFLKN